MSARWAAVRAVTGAMWFALFLLGCPGSAPGGAALDPPQDLLLDPPGDEHWWGGFGIDGADGRVEGATRYRGGILLYGSFTHVQGVPAEGIAWWDGTTWSPIGSALKGEVTSLAVDRDVIFAAGDLEVDGIYNPSLATWDGQAWQRIWFGALSHLVLHEGRLLAVLPPGGADADSVVEWVGHEWRRYGDRLPFTILDTCEVDGVLYVIGRGYALPRYFVEIVRETEHGWESLGRNAYGSHRSLATYQGSLHSCGSSGVHRWTGTDWVDVGTPNGLIDAEAISVFNGDLYLTGRFAAADLFPDESKLVRWDGADWLDVGSFAVSRDDRLSTVGDTLVSMGSFSSAGGVTAHNFAFWDGTTWSSPGGHGGAGLPTTVNALLSWNGDLIAAGYFDRIGAQSALGIARWDGAQWHPLGHGTTRAIPDLCEFRGDLIASRFGFPSSSEEPSGLARWDGETWHTLRTAESPGAYAHALTVFEDRLVVVEESDTMKVWTWDGSTWSRLPDVPGAFDAAAAVVHDGSLYLGGSFHGVDGYGSCALVRWDDSGWRAMGSWTHGSIRDLCVYEGQLVAAGSFQTAAGFPAEKIARFDGETWRQIGHDSQRNVECVAVYHGTLVAAFGAYYGSGGGYPARWVDGEWQRFGSGLEGDPRDLYVDISAFAIHDGALWMSGKFTSAGGKPSYGIARWDDVPPSSDAGTGLVRVVYPQPSPRDVTVLYDLPAMGRIRVQVFDTLGRRVCLVRDRVETAGRHGATWTGYDETGRRSPSGVYFLRVEGPTRSDTRRIVLVH